MSWNLEAGGSNDVACECCGERSRTVDGFLYEDGIARAGYLVQWTRGHVDEHGANFDFIVGPWGEDAGATARSAVSLVYHRDSGFTVIDAADRPAARSDLAGRALPRADVVGSDLAQKVFAMADLVWLCDERISEISSAG